MGKGALAGHCFPPGAARCFLGLPPTLQPLCLPRTSRSSGSGRPSTCLGGAVPWLPSTSWASSTWPTLGTAGTAPQGSPQLCSGTGDTPGEWGGARGLAGEEHPAPSLLGEGGGGRTGKSHPLPAPCPGDNVLCCDLCVCCKAVELPPKIWDVLPSFLITSSLLRRWLWMPWPLLLALAWAAGWRVKTALSKAFILEYTSYQ